jgi:NADH:ubiquinone oxidoreductase subunit K
MLISASTLEALICRRVSRAGITISADNVLHYNKVQIPSDMEAANIEYLFVASRASAEKAIALGCTVVWFRVN